MLAKFKSENILKHIDSLVDSSLFIHTEDSEGASEMTITNFNAFDEDQAHQPAQLRKLLLRQSYKNNDGGHITLCGLLIAE